MIAVALFGWGLLALPGLARRHLSRLHPGLWSRLTAWALGVGSGLIALGLLATSVPTLLERVGAHHLAALCRRLLHDLLAGGHVGGLIAGGLLAVLSYRWVAGWRRLSRARRTAVVEPWVGDHRVESDYELVVIAASEPIALAAGGPARQVILSSGLIEGLSEYELTMVVRHELAHLRRRHHRHLMIAATAEATFGWLPLVSSSAQAMRLGVERWADEEAAGTDPRARRTLGSALVTAAGCRPQPGVAGLGDVEMAVERLKALETSPPAGLSRWWYPVVGVVTTAAASLGVTSMAVVGISLGSGGICYF